MFINRVKAEMTRNSIQEKVIAPYVIFLLYPLLASDRTPTGLLFNEINSKILGFLWPQNPLLKVP